jgi:C4-type Zn-finger protein
LIGISFIQRINIFVGFVTIRLHKVTKLVLELFPSATNRSHRRHLGIKLRAADTAMAVFTKAEQRFNSGSATKVDEVLLALWEETKEQAQKIRELTMKIAMLETEKSVTVVASSEYALMVQRMTSKADKSHT